MAFQLSNTPAKAGWAQTVRNMAGWEDNEEQTWWG